MTKELAEDIKSAERIQLDIMKELSNQGYAVAGKKSMISLIMGMTEMWARQEAINEERKKFADWLEVWAKPVFANQWNEGYNGAKQHYKAMLVLKDKIKELRI